VGVGGAEFFQDAGIMSRLSRSLKITGTNTDRSATYTTSY